MIDKVESKLNEKLGWKVLTEKSLEKIWRNKKEDEIWDKYVVKPN